MGKPLILLIEDERHIAQFIRISLDAEGYQCDIASDGATGLRRFRENPPDAVILDLGLPDMTGNQVLSSIRQQSRAPVLILTARDEEDDKVRLLMGGANDYLCKPFGVPELIARIHVLLRDRAGSQAQVELHFDGLRIDTASRAVYVDELGVSLSPKEFAVLVLLAQAGGDTVLQQDLLKSVWGPTHAKDTHYLRVLFTSLRKKLGESADAPRFIRTLPGVGYVFIAKPLDDQ